MVYLSVNGHDHVLPPRGGDLWGYPRPTLRALRNGQYYAVHWVSLAERRTWVQVPTGPAGPSGPRTSHYQVAWRVKNPVVAARSDLTEERAVQEIVRHIGARAVPPGTPDPLTQPPPRYGTVQVEPPGQPRAIDDKGLVYWFLDPPEGFLTGQAADHGPVLPPVFGEAHREAYRFYREVVKGGPADLAAFWLLQHPEQAKDVLDWTVEHRDLLADRKNTPPIERDSWEYALAEALRDLTEEDRAFLGANMAGILKDLGVPEGDEVLRRINADAPPPPRHDGGLAGSATPGSPW